VSISGTPNSALKQRAEYRLQRLELEWLLHDRARGPLRGQAVPAIAGRENKRYLRFGQRLRELIARITAEINVKNRRVRTMLRQHPNRILGRAGDPNLPTAEIEQHLLDDRSDHLLVLNHEDI